MSDYSESKKFLTKAYPVSAEITTDLLKRVEPILTPELLVSRYLRGVDLKGYTPDELKDKITLAMNTVELNTGLTLTKTQRMQRIPYDASLYKSFIYIKAEHGPVLSVEKLSVLSSNNEHIFDIPPQWIETGFATTKNQINVVPILGLLGASGLERGQATNAGLVFLQAIQTYNWLPAFWGLEYTTGISHSDGVLPIVVNELIGMEAAIDVLDSLQTLYLTSSQGISQDGISQNFSMKDGSNVYSARINNLMMKKELLQDKIKSIFSQKYFFTSM